MMDEPVNEIVGGELYQYYPLGEHVVRAVGVCGGRPTFKYTRLEVAGILECLASGQHIDDIVEDYQGRISHEAIFEAITLTTSRFVETLPELKAA